MIDTVGLVSRYDNAFIPKLSPSYAAWFRILARQLHADPTITDQRWTAYILGTVKRETGSTFTPITERGNTAYFFKYEPSTEVGKRLGNTRAGDGYRYRGRGYVQITGRNNYTRFSEIIGRDLIADPDLALDEETAYKILTIGMVKGIFTGKSLSDYINDKGRDFFNARRIVNGLDHAQEIAESSMLFWKILQAVEKTDPPESGNILT